MATREAIRKFVDGVGDINPIFRDKEYAKKTKYECLIAPPSFLYTVYPTLQQVGLPGVHGFHSGNEWEFLKPIFVDDKITAECSIIDVQEKESEFSGRIVIVYFVTKYFRNYEEIARAKAWTIRAERRAAREKGKYSTL